MLLIDDYKAFKKRYPSHQILRLPAFKVLLFYRLGRLFKGWRIPILPSVCSAILRIVYGVEISYKAQIGIGVNIVHPVGVVIGSAIVGDGCKFLGSNTIGGGRSEHDLPTLGRNVEIGCGARIVGKITIGDSVTIGSNSVVIRDIPSQCFAAGLPAKIIRQYGVKND